MEARGSGGGVQRVGDRTVRIEWQPAGKGLSLSLSVVKPPLVSLER